MIPVVGAATTRPGLKHYYHRRKLSGTLPSDSLKRGAQRKLDYSALLAAGAKALVDNAATRKAAAEARKAAVKTRDASSRTGAAVRQVRHTTREFVLTFLPHRFRPVSGASDRNGNGALSPREHVWIAANTDAATRCAVCDKAIPVGDPMYEIVVDGLGVRLGPACGRRHMDWWRDVHHKHLATQADSHDSSV